MSQPGKIVAAAMPLWRPLWRFMVLLWLLAGLAGALRAETPVIKMAVLKFGTVNWAMDVIKHHRLDEKNGFRLELLGLASKNATSVAFLSNDVNAFVTDWFWVLRQRSLGNNLVILPYSAALGAVMVKADGPIQTLTGLNNARIGVAGGPIDKSWLLLRAHMIAQHQDDPAQSALPVYAAPPLLNQQMLSARLDAVLNFWPFAARLQAAGYRRLISVEDLMLEMGMAAPVPLVGFTFRARTNDGVDNAALIKGFADAFATANEKLRGSDAEWRRLAPLMKAADEAEFIALRDGYRRGIVNRWDQRQINAAERLFDLLVALGGDQLAGKDTQFNTGIFWTGSGS